MAALRSVFSRTSVAAVRLRIDPIAEAAAGRSGHHWAASTLCRSCYATVPYMRARCRAHGASLAATVPTVRRLASPCNFRSRHSRIRKPRRAMIVFHLVNLDFTRVFRSASPPGCGATAPWFTSSTGSSTTTEACRRSSAAAGPRASTVRSYSRHLTNACLLGLVGLENGIPCGLCSCTCTMAGWHGQSINFSDTPAHWRCVVCASSCAHVATTACSYHLSSSPARLGSAWQAACRLYD